MRGTLYVVFVISPSLNGKRPNSEFPTTGKGVFLFTQSCSMLRQIHTSGISCRHQVLGNTCWPRLKSFDLICNIYLFILPSLRHSAVNAAQIKWEWDTFMNSYRWEVWREMAVGIERKGLLNANRSLIF